MRTFTPSNPIALKPSDRGIVVGANGTGKSTLSGWLIEKFRQDVPHCRVLILDSKPRWRGEILSTGAKPGKLYDKLMPGDVVPGAMLMDDMGQWGLVWDKNVNPSQTVIAQRITTNWRDQKATQRAAIAFMVQCAERFFATQDVRVPSLLYVDEGHDFFHASAAARGSDILQRCYRAGRERGLATLSAFQRPVGLNLQLLTELNYCALFRINYSKDVRRLWEMGWPSDTGPPTYEQAKRHEFRLWREGSDRAPLYALNINQQKAS
jgi:hypothetical protein